MNAIAITFFGGIERLYNFFILKSSVGSFMSSHVKVMTKRLVTTCWSACYEAIREVKTGFQGAIQALDLLTSASENLQRSGDAQIILLSI